MNPTHKHATISDGVWPTMVTPFTRQGQVDYRTLDDLVEWYLQRGAAGLFAVCQSSEMFHLSPAERIDISRRIVDRVARRCGVIAAGHISGDRSEQIEEVIAIGETGVDAVVLLNNRFTDEGAEENAWIDMVASFLADVPERLSLALYECPVPYKRLLRAREFDYLCTSNRFAFLKDTSCDITILRARADRVRGTCMKLFNANTATLLPSLRMGYAGYSGVMANFHPELYVRLIAGHTTGDARIDELQQFLTIASVFELRGYPANAKYAISLDGVPITTRVRRLDCDTLTEMMKEETRQLHAYSRRLAHTIGVIAT